MASSSASEKELGDKLIEAGNMLLSPPSSIEELLTQLDSLELYLSKVDQAPPKSLQDALLPAMKALIAEELLKHTDTDVKISVALCINEITRITAPDAPYNDEQMKDCFQLTITAFGKLSHVSSRSYTKAVSILDTVAKVRSSLVMLDLQCDALVIEMFQVFLKFIRPDHPHAVFENMDFIMTLIIEESEDISLELLSTLLDSVKKENQNALPMSFKLGEKVINNCAAKLKSYIMKAVESKDIDLNDYVQTVPSICKTLSDNLEQNHVSSCEEQMVVSELAPGVVCPGEVGAGLEGNVDTAQTKDDEASADKNPLKSLSRCQSKQSESIDDKGNDESDNLETVKPVKLEIEPETVLKKRGRKPNSLMNPEEGYDHSWIRRERKDPKLPGRRKKLDKVKEIDDSPSENLVSQEEASPSPVKNAASQDLSPEISQSETIGASSTAKGSLPDESHPKRDRRQKEGSLTQQDVHKDSPLAPMGPLFSTPIEDKLPETPHGKHVESKDFQEISQSMTIDSTYTLNPNLPDGSSKRGQRQKKGSMRQQVADKKYPLVPEGPLISASVEDEAPKLPDASVKKEAEDISNLVEKTPRHTDKKTVAANTIELTTPTPGDAVLKEEGLRDFEEIPMAESIMNVSAEGPNEKVSLVQCRDGEKRRGRPKRAVTEESGEKKMAGSRTKSLNESNLDVTPKQEMKRKRTPGKEEGSNTPHSVKDLDERLIGSRIKVWWPKDKTFYDGVVYSYDHIKKKHKVLYADGDEEVLNLGKQRWELVGDEIVPDEGIKIDDASNEGSFDVLEKKEKQILENPIKNSKSKTSTMKGKTASSSKRVGPSTDKPADDSALNNPFVLDNPESHNTGEESNAPETGGPERLSDLADVQARLRKGGRKRNRGISV